jgi:hypothetical protein
MHKADLGEHRRVSVQVAVLPSLGISPPDAETGIDTLLDLCHAALSTIFAATSMDFCRSSESIEVSFLTATLLLSLALTLPSLLPPVTFHISADRSLL